VGTSSISAESRLRSTAAAPSQAARFELLKTRIDKAVQERGTPGYWEDRHVEASVSDEFLALSWEGSKDYWAARSWARKLKGLSKSLADRPSYLPDIRQRREEEIAKAIGKQFREKRPGPYALECFVFFKTSNIAPAALVHMAHGCVPAFENAPLHTYFVIRREQPAVDKYEDLYFTAFKADTKTHRDEDALIRHLFDSIYLPKAPIDGGGTETEPCRLCRTLGLLALVLLLAAAVALAIPQSRERLFDALGLARQAQVDAVSGELSELRAEYDALAAQALQLSLDLEQARAAELETGGAPDVPDDMADEAAAAHEAAETDLRARLAETEAELARLAGLLEQRGAPVPDDRMPLGLPPCLPVEPTASPHGGAPGYLFDIRLSGAGIALRSPRGPFALSDADRADPDFPVDLTYPADPLSVPAFERLASPISRAAAEAGCAQYVLLREGAAGGRDRYIAQRDAVERHFYVYRPQP